MASSNQLHVHVQNNVLRVHVLIQVKVHVHVHVCVYIQWIDDIIMAMQTSSVPVLISLNFASCLQKNGSYSTIKRMSIIFCTRC